MKKKFTILITALALLTMGVLPGRAVGQTPETEDVTLSSGTYSTDHIVWSFADGNITIQQLKGTSSTAVNSNYIAAPRVYKGHYLSFVCSDNYTINSISIKCDGSYYGNSMTAGTVVSNNTVTSNTTDISATWTTTAGGSHVVSSVSDAGLPAIYIQNVASANNTQLRITKLTITYTHTSSSATATTVTIDDTDLTNTDVYTSTVAGSLSATVTETDSGDAVSGASVTWSSSNTSVATIASDGTVTLVAAGTTTITASYAGESGVYGSSSATYDLTVTSSAPYVQPTSIEITPNYTFWGKTGQFSGDTYNELDGSQDNVSLHWTRGNGSTYANLSAMRFYKDNDLTFTAPEGYEIISIKLTVSGTYSDLSFSPTGYDNETTTWTGAAEIVTMSRPSNASSYATISKFTITLASSGSGVATTTTINVPANFNTDIYQGSTAGTLTATVKDNENNTISGATVTWSSSSTDVATIDAYGEVTLIAVGTTTITASYAGVEDEYNPSSATYELTVIDSYAPGSVNNPYTVAQAIAATPASGTTGDVYIHGVVSAFWNNNTTILGDNSHRYYISDDGGTTTQLLVYNGKGLNNVAFSNANDLLIGDEITLVGKLKTFSNAPEVDANNYIVSLVRPTVDVEAPTFSPAAGTYATGQTVTISCETTGAKIYYTTNGTTPTNESTEYTGVLNVITTTTFKAIAIKGSDASTVTTATYHINSQANPYTVAQALAFHEYPANEIYVHGIVSTAPTQDPTNNGELTYYISDDGTTTDQLEVYKGKGLDNTAFTAQDDIQVGDIVTIYGNVQVYNNTIEFGSGNYLVEFERPKVATPTFNPVSGEYTEAQTVAINCATEGATIYYKFAENAEWTEFTTVLNIAETKTIWAYATNEGMADSDIVTATYTITIAPTASIEVTPTVVNATADETEGTFTVTLTAIEDNEIEVLWFESDGETPATEPEWISTGVNANHNIDYLIEENEGEARSAYFKVFGIDGEANDVYSELITINQAAPVVPPTPGTEQWVLTPLADLAVGDVFVIVGTRTDETYGGDYAMSNDNGTSGAPSAVAVTVSEGTLSGEIDETIQWNISGNTKDGYTFYPNEDNENWLYCTNTNNGVRVGTNTNKVFVLDSESNYLKHVATSRYIGVYCDKDKTDWRCYTSTSGNIADQSFAFYKKVTSTEPSIALSSYSINAPASETIEVLTITPANIENFDINYLSADYCNPDGSTIDDKPDFVSFDFSEDEGYKLTCTISVNDGDARTAYFKVIYELGENDYVYSNVVTVNQEAAPVATIIVDPDKYLNVPAASDVYVHTVTLENMTVESTDDFALAFCDENGEVLDDQASKPDWIEIGEVEFTSTSEENVYSLAYPVAENTETTARTAYFKVAATQTSGTVYSNLVTVTQEAAAQAFTVSFVVNGTPDRQETGISIPLPTQSEHTPAGFEIVGWALENSTEPVADPYEPTAVVTLYALLQLENAPEPSENYVKVTENLEDWSGEYLIVYEDGGVAFDGSADPLDASNNTISVTIANDRIEVTDETEEAMFTIAPMENGYSIRNTNNLYIGQTKNDNGLATDESEILNTLNYSDGNVDILSSGAYLRYNAASNQARFRYYKSSSYTGQQAIQLYKKTTSTPAVFNTVSVIEPNPEPMAENIPATTCIIVPTDVVLTFSGENQGTAANLIIEDGGQLINNSTSSVAATVKKNIVGHNPSAKDGVTGYCLISSPINNMAPADAHMIAATAEDYDLYRFDQTKKLEWINYKSSLDNGGQFNLMSGQGYLYANKENETLEFAGTIYNGNGIVYLTLDNTSAFAGWNLVGNPFTQNTYIDRSYYVMKDDGSKILADVVSEDNPIKPMQGIFVIAKENNEQMTFSKEPQSSSNNNGSLTLNVNQAVNTRGESRTNLVDRAIVRFGVNDMLPKFQLNDNSSKVYFTEGNKDYAVVSAEAQGEMPVYFKAAENGTYTLSFSMNNVEFGYLHLIDNKTGNDVDLRQTPSYTFEASTIDYASRFRLVFRAIGNDNDSENNDFGFFDANGNLLILGIEGTATLQVMDVTGRVISNETFSGDYSKAINASAGVYMLRLIQGSDVRTQKVVVK